MPTSTDNLLPFTSLISVQRRDVESVDLVDLVDAVVTVVLVFQRRKTCSFSTFSTRFISLLGPTVPRSVSFLAAVTAVPSPFYLSLSLSFTLAFAITLGSSFSFPLRRLGRPAFRCYMTLSTASVAVYAAFSNRLYLLFIVLVVTAGIHTVDFHLIGGSDRELRSHHGDDSLFRRLVFLKLVWILQDGVPQLRGSVAK